MRTADLRVGEHYAFNTSKYGTASKVLLVDKELVSRASFTNAKGVTVTFVDYGSTRTSVVDVRGIKSTWAEYEAEQAVYAAQRAEQHAIQEAQEAEHEANLAALAALLPKDVSDELLKKVRENPEARYHTSQRLTPGDVLTLVLAAIEHAKATS
jgi:NADP-dependent 3-hydroxy acid dehydrogenase YdfG